MKAIAFLPVVTEPAQLIDVVSRAAWFFARSPAESIAIPVGALATVLGKPALLIGAIAYLVLPVASLKKIPPDRSRLVPGLVLGVSCLLCFALFSVEWTRPASADHPHPGVSSFVLAVLLSVTTMLVVNRRRFPVEARG